MMFNDPNLQAQADDRERIDLVFSCRNINLADSRFNKEHILNLKRKIAGDNWVLIGKTEISKNNPNPDFAHSFEIDFVFETLQTYKVELVNVQNQNVLEGIVLGETIFDVAEIVGSLNNMRIYDLLNPGTTTVAGGKVIVRSDKVVNTQQKSLISFTLAARGVPKFNLFSSQNSFLKLHRLRNGSKSLQGNNYGLLPTSEWLLFHTTSHVKDSNPSFGKMSFKSSKLCHGNFDLPVKVELWKYKDDGSHYPMGYAIFTVKELMSSHLNFQFNLLKDKGANTSLVVSGFASEELFDFTDFLRGNLNINLLVGVDFTASNGDYEDPSSLHHFVPNSLNLYQKAILSVGEILEYYNHNHAIPAYGFGAKIGNPPTISHFFPINMNYQNPFFETFGDLFQAYETILQNVLFSGPTFFSPLIQKGVEFAKTRYSIDPYNYNVLLILTDGIINDLQETIDQIVEASTLPLSIIIIGIGNADFKNMNALDADQNPLIDSKGRRMQRDIVQFVPFNQFANNPFALRAEVLAELPNQVVQFYHLNKIRPRVLPAFNINQFPNTSALMNNPELMHNPQQKNYKSLESMIKKSS